MDKVDGMASLKGAVISKLDFWTLFDEAVPGLQHCIAIINFGQIE